MLFRSRSRKRAQEAARALRNAPELETAVPRLRDRLRRLSGELRFEDAARLRDRLAALERVQAELARLDRLRGAELCLLAPALEEGWKRAFFVAGGRVVETRTLPPGAGARLEWEAGLHAVDRAEVTYAPEAADELLLVYSFMRRPPPELEVVPLRQLREWRSSAGRPAA